MIPTALLKRLLLLLAPLLALGSGPALAQERSPTASVIAVPPFAITKNVDTDAGNTWSIANQIADLISADLNTTSSFIVANVKDIRIPSYPEVTAPSYPTWRAARVKLLLSGFVSARNDGRLTIGCYLYDVQSGREVARQGFAVTPGEWRRAAHRCADAAYVEATGNSPRFDSRIAYVAESGSPDSPVKRLAVMDFDGASHSYVTEGDATVMSPSWSPTGNRVAYSSFRDGRLHVRIVDLATRQDRPLLPVNEPSFGPAFSPDGRAIALSMSAEGNTDIFTVDSSGGYPRRLTTSQAIDTSPSYSPDGNRIAFVSDRSGSPQIYVMDFDGSNQRRISFGPGAYGSPTWSPDGERIAFTRTEGPTSRIGTIAAGGSGERIVTSGPRDEEPEWSPDGSKIVFQQYDAATRRTLLATVPADGGEVRAIPTPQGGSDPAWAGRKE